MADPSSAAARLYEQTLEFSRKTADYALTRDVVMLQVATEKYRQEVDRAARAGHEHWLPWQTLGSWTTDGKQRIGCFSRVLELMEKDPALTQPANPHHRWVREHNKAESLYEIGRVHAREGSREVARSFFEKALPHARAAEDVREAAGANDDRLEGKIASALMMLDAEA